MNGKWHRFLDVIETKISHLSDFLLKRTRWQMVCHSWQMANGTWHLLREATVVSAGPLLLLLVLGESIVPFPIAFILICLPFITFFDLPIQIYSAQNFYT
jgi:hypothetical protein